jgi:hypothetical protein
LIEPDVCFACGMEASGFERCHIFPRVKGGPESADNLHMLCKVCHKDSEYLEGEAYWRWFWERTASDMLMSRAARSGLNLWALMNDPVIAGD